MLRYGRALSTVRASLGATGPRMTLETQMSTNVVMPPTDDAFVASWRQLSDVIRGVCRKLAQVAKESSRNLAEKMASRNWLVLRHRVSEGPGHFLISWLGGRVPMGPQDLQETFKIDENPEGAGKEAWFVRRRANIWKDDLPAGKRHQLSPTKNPENWGLKKWSTA